jgi:transcriptional regulator with XRE-family HTH domain
MTQKEVADKAGITPNYFALIERGIKSPSNEVVVEIIKSLGVSSKDILGV